MKYNEVVDYKKYKDYGLVDSHVAGHLGDYLRSNHNRYSKDDLIEIIWNLEQVALEEQTLDDLWDSLRALNKRIG